MRRIRDLDLDAEAEAARQAAMEAEGQAEEDEFAEDMAALQEVMGQPLPAVRGYGRCLMMKTWSTCVVRRIV